ncbi:MAG: hypothetical protein JO127_09325 [Caulobacteraceae bacterium]|nr:hypothetical protein [Caulobacteraceae bacterium]
MTEASELPQDLAFEVELDAPPEKVWRALAIPEIRAAWLGEPDAGAAEAQILEAGARLSIRWPIDRGVSQIVIEIAPAGAGTRLRVTHTPAASAEVVALPVRAGGGAVMAAALRRAA